MTYDGKQVNKIAPCLGVWPKTLYHSAHTYNGWESNCESHGLSYLHLLLPLGVLD